MCSGSEAGSYLRLIDFVYHSTLGLRVMKKKKKTELGKQMVRPNRHREQPHEKTRGAYSKQLKN